MGLKKVLVLNGGQIEQLQSTDWISAVQIPQFTNGNAGAIVIGAPVYISANNTVDKAKADAVGTVNVIGLAYDASTASAASGGVLIDGVLTASTAQWDAVAGTSGGLTKDVIYYLSAATAGLLTSTAPSAAGQFVVAVGIGLSTTDMKIEIQPRIKL
jgi:hypothetical protein